MAKRSSTSSSEHDRRLIPPNGHTLAGVPVRDDDIETTRGLHSVAILFRIMSGLMGGLLIVQIINGVTSAVPISFGVLVAEAMRLIIFAGLLWGAGDLADLFVKSHYDVRATRILLGRLTHLVSQMPGTGEPRLGEGDRGATPGDSMH
jgi:hypothetical protein